MNSPTALVADTYIGNLHEQPNLISNAQAVSIKIDRKDCCKGRIFVEAETGQAVGIVKGRDWLLRDGDVLSTSTGQHVVVRIKQQQVIAVGFRSDAHNHAVNLVQFGHVLGNQHWPVAVEGQILYVELVADVELVESTILEIAKTLNIKGLRMKRLLKSPDQFVSFDQGKHTHHHAH